MTTATTIQGASILPGGRRPPGDVFDLSLSPDGIEIRRAGLPPAHMPWAQVSQWEIEERRDGVLLTLRGGGATTPLVVPGWSLDDLEAVMRTTAGASAEAAAARPAGDAGSPDAAADPSEPVADAFAGTPAPAPQVAGPATPPGRRWRVRRPSAATGKAVVTVVLLGLLATAVALVLLQSAGVINWGFLGPTA